MNKTIEILAQDYATENAKLHLDIAMLKSLVMEKDEQIRMLNEALKNTPTYNKKVEETTNE